MAGGVEQNHNPALPSPPRAQCFAPCTTPSFLTTTSAKLDTSALEQTHAGRSLSDSSLPFSFLDKELTTSASSHGGLPKQQDATTLTELCSSTHVPEVEIISLLQEQLPQYQLRADTVFGYDHGDWIHTPLVASDAASCLTPHQIKETLEYFLLCSERVSRITKTYHDIDAVTSLLEEKEHDLELAARIGQSLLKQNRSLSERNELLEEQLELAKEEIAQLRHEISMRDDLLHLYTNSTEESEPASAIPTPLRRNESALSLQQCFQYDALQQKLKALEEENQKLRTEVTSITTEMCHYEEQEQKLMIDCVEQFSDASREVVSLSEELARKVDDSARQQEEISQLLAQIVDLQQKCRTYGLEVEELQQHLNAAKQGQQQLRTELQDLQEKYAECGAMLQEAQEEIKNLRNRSLPNSTIHRHSSPTFLPLDSLAAEIKGTMRKGTNSSASSEYKGYRRIFETVKAVKQAAKAKSWAESPLTLPPGSPKPSSLGCSRISTPHSSYYGSDSPPAGALEVQDGQATEGLDDARQGEPGTSGIPGQHDLEAALQCLSARQENHSTERSFFEVERERKLRHLARDAEDSSGFLTPNESITSTGTNYSGSSGGSGFSLSSFSYFPDKLQIIKPLEGSMTLHHWQQLAQPHLAGILDPRPGVLTKDFRQLDTDLEEVYNLNDLEEDEVDVTSFPALSTSTPSKAKGGPSVFLSVSVFHSVNNLPQTPPTFTITTCCILHPSNEVTMVTPSLYNTVVPSCGPCAGLSPQPPPPCPLQEQPSRPEAEQPERCASPRGLVSLLTERGISAWSGAGAAARAAALTRYAGGSGSLFGLSPSLALLWCYRRDAPAEWALGSCPPQRRKSEEGQKSIFSLNLVEKLRRLGLDTVVARGEASYATARLQELHQRKTSAS
ncbi:huntingtin-associated protein 1 [Varanus komodoensis]|uniref:huntingtin-associated protein 1 n=1 Tax=Varanus komodoensis TaxID=61221 RepID=UPI001CF7BC56|nr:huntingtin-associated protein 1 [Varanus komodoensis]